MHIVIYALKNVNVDRSKNMQSQQNIMVQLLMKINVHLYQTVM